MDKILDKALYMKKNVMSTMRVETLTYSVDSTRRSKVYFYAIIVRSLKGIISLALR